MDSAKARGSLLRFGVFELNLKTSELRKDGALIKLPPQPLKVLALLTSRPGDLVTREEIQREIWRAETMVDSDQGLNFAVKKIRVALGDDAGMPRYLETLRGRGYRFIAPVEQVDGATGSTKAVQRTRRIHSVAVLPLESLSRGKGQDYFVDGMTEELITELGKIQELRVISRTSAMLYKGARKPLGEIARELNVDAVVGGAVLRCGHRVRITAQLIQVATDTHLWAETYERNVRDILSLQAEVARAIANEVKVRLTPREQARLASARPVDPETYELYLKGRYFWNKGIGEGLYKAVEYFTQAIRKDPSYAPAHAGLAGSYNTLGVWNLMPPKDAFPKAKAAASRALEIDNTLTEAHAALGRVRLHCDWDWRDAEREFQRAIELNPSYAPARSWYSECLAGMERLDEAMTEAKRALDLDPLSLMVKARVGWISYLARRYEAAIELERRTLEMDPNCTSAHYYLGVAYEQEARYQEAIEEFQTALSLSGCPITLGALGHAYAVSGESTRALKVLDRLKRLSKQRYVSPYSRALIYAGLGHNDHAFAWLQKAAVERGQGGHGLTNLKVDPRLDSLRSDPRFRRLVRLVCQQ